DRGPARGRRGRRGPQRRPAREGARRPRLRLGAPPGGGGRPRPGLPRRGLRVAARGVLDVPRHEPRRPPTRGAVRIDVEPQLRGPAGAGGPHAPRQPADGGRGRAARPFRRRPDARPRAGGGVKPVRVARGRVAILDRPDVDTDQIIPKQFLKRIERTGYGQFAFFDWRYDEEGRERPEFELNR